MSQGFTVRRLGAEDVDAFRVVRMEALERSPEAFLTTPREQALRSREQDLAGLRDGAVFGAIAGETIVGTAGFHRYTQDKARHKGVVWGLYVRQDFRGRGVAAALLQAVIAHARGEVEILGLSVIPQNDSARRLYERFGFVAYGTEPRAMKQGETYFDEIHMALRLA
jgi:ribosomal protein S18 acetylase RimI-like enzyme